MSGLVFMGWINTKRRIKCLAQRHSTVTPPVDILEQASNPLIFRLTLYQLSEPLLFAFQCTSWLACFERLEVQPLRLGAIICNISVFYERGTHLTDSSGISLSFGVAGRHCHEPGQIHFFIVYSPAITSIYPLYRSIYRFLRYISMHPLPIVYIINQVNGYFHFRFCWKSQ